MVDDYIGDAPKKKAEQQAKEQQRNAQQEEDFKRQKRNVQKIEMALAEVMPVYERFCRELREAGHAISCTREGGYSTILRVVVEQNPWSYDYRSSRRNPKTYKEKYFYEYSYKNEPLVRERRGIFGSGLLEQPSGFLTGPPSLELIVDLDVPPSSSHYDSSYYKRHTSYLLPVKNIKEAPIHTEEEVRNLVNALIADSESEPPPSSAEQPSFTGPFRGWDTRHSVLIGNGFMHEYDFYRFLKQGNRKQGIIQPQQASEYDPTGSPFTSQEKATYGAVGVGVLVAFAVFQRLCN